jgi:hypothetical protein
VTREVVGVFVRFSLRRFSREQCIKYGNNIMLLSGANGEKRNFEDSLVG